MNEPLNLPTLDLLPELPDGGWLSVPGTRAGVAGGDIKGNGKVRDDVALLVAPGAVTAAVTTRSTAAAAPCRWTRARVPGPSTAVVVNAGNANAATGRQGDADVATTAAHVAALLGCPVDEVLVCSTGVIGVPLPMERLLGAVDRAATLDASGPRLARAILTTDLVAKASACRIGGVTVGGFTKGSGMIHPGMATMLGFVATDAAVGPDDLQELVAALAEESFNAISVDGDMSTNDTLIVQATGEGRPARPGSEAWEALVAGLRSTLIRLARMIAQDGEGATTLVECVVQGTPDDAAARRAARQVIGSPLVKSAIHGRDPNWGRIVGALGAAEVAGLDQLDLDLAGVPVLRGGQPIDWDEQAASRALEAPEVRISIRLPGAGLGRAWGCDLTADYVKINADYRS